MGTVSYTESAVLLSGREHGRKVVWANMANGDVGSPYEKPPWSDRAIQVTGTFGSGGNCRIQGSIDGSTYATLTDPQGNDLDFTSAKIEQITEATVLVRPSVTAGDGTTSVTVTLLMLRKFK